MVPLVLNRDLLPSDVPDVPAGELDLPDVPVGGGHGAAWAQVWRFALSFDPETYSSETGVALESAAVLAEARSRMERGDLRGLDFASLRAALAFLYWDCNKGATVGREDALLVDGLLDAIFASTSGGAKRPRGKRPALERGLGWFGKNFGPGQVRFWFAPRQPADRAALYDRVAGLLLREVAEDFTVSALYLYPPLYSPESEPARSPVETLMLLLERRGRPESADQSLEREYERLTHLVVEQMADKTLEHSPDS